jgi:XTP/dITP diphosphohydrolase
VRRWSTDERLTDQAVLDLALDRLARVPAGERGAQFRTVFAVGVRGQPLALFEGTLRGVILERADPLRIPGFPFESIFFVPEWGLLLGEVHRMSAQAKATFITHRERALLHALPHIRALLHGGG